MSPSINGSDSNPSALLLSEIAELARSHQRQTRSTYHGTASNTTTSPKSGQSTPGYSPHSPDGDAPRATSRSGYRSLSASSSRSNFGSSNRPNTPHISHLQPSLPTAPSSSFVPGFVQNGSMPPPMAMPQQALGSMYEPAQVPLPSISSDRAGLERISSDRISSERIGSDRVTNASNLSRVNSLIRVNSLDRVNRLDHKGLAPLNTGVLGSNVPHMTVNSPTPGPHGNEDIPHQGMNHFRSASQKSSPAGSSPRALGSATSPSSVSSAMGPASPSSTISGVSAASGPTTPKLPASNGGVPEGASSTSNAASQEALLVGQTDVDRMMLLVQQKAREDENQGSASDLTFQCDRCGKRFRQRAHLHTHMRSHTGERPFTCPFPECGKDFSQRCNLRTHIRSHTGERPYVCEHCGRGFSQQGNMRHHQLTHYNDHPLFCKLEGCMKRFNQLGNLKAHQNTAHREIVHAFTERLKNGSKREELPPEDREMFDYFCELYKNSNRGIRGRGKGTKTICDRVPPRSRHADVPPSYADHSMNQLDHINAREDGDDNGSYELQESPGQPKKAQSQALPAGAPQPDFVYSEMPSSEFPAGVPRRQNGDLAQGRMHGAPPGAILPSMSQTNTHISQASSQAQPLTGFEQASPQMPTGPSVGPTGPTGSLRPPNTQLPAHMSLQFPQEPFSRAQSEFAFTPRSTAPNTPILSHQTLQSASQLPASQLPGAYPSDGFLPPQFQSASQRMPPPTFATMGYLKEDSPKLSSSLIPPMNAPPLAQSGNRDKRPDPTTRQYYTTLFNSMPAPV